MIYPDELSVPTDWEKQNLAVFKFAIIRYLACLDKIKGEGNKKVEIEIETWSKVLQNIRNEIKKLSHESEQGQLILLGKDYGKLYDILWKHYSAKKQLLEERKSKILEEAAHQGATEELEYLNILLGLGFWSQVTRHKTLVASFYAPEEIKKEHSSVAMQITIGNLYGQFAAFNNGTMIQNNNSEAVQALREITEALVDSNLEEDVKQEVLMDIESIQSQMKKERPNKSFLEIGLKSLQVAANLAQISSVVAPQLSKIQEFISSLT